eukprot:m.21323 g.21323  ORF g.21323 m.21323 type:complete len:324 (+) comp11125_c0_seq1:65-1036(+)
MSAFMPPTFANAAIDCNGLSYCTLNSLDSSSLSTLGMPVDESPSDDIIDAISAALSDSGSDTRSELSSPDFSLEATSPLNASPATWEMLFPPSWQQRPGLAEFIPNPTDALWPGATLGADMDLFATKNPLFDLPSTHFFPSSLDSCSSPLAPTQAALPTSSTTTSPRPRRAASAGSAATTQILQHESLDDILPAKRSKQMDGDYSLPSDISRTPRARRRSTQSRKKTSGPRAPRLQSKEGARQRLKALCKLYLTHKSQHPSTDPEAFILWVRETRFRKADTRCNCANGPSHECSCTTCAHCRFEKNVQLCVKGDINWPYKQSA